MGKVFAHTKPTIVSVRVSDDQMENITRLMERMNKTASDIMREAFYLLADQYDAAPMEEASEERSTGSLVKEAHC